MQLLMKTGLTELQATRAKPPVKIQIINEEDNVLQIRDYSY